MESSRAKNYSLESPTQDFEKRSKENFDRYWINPQNGNAISLQTSCNKSLDPSLDNLLQKNLKGINDIKEIEREEIHYNEREALSTLHIGEVDGVPVKIKTIVFKKNHCNYSLNYFGVKGSFQKDLSTFERFIKNFRVKS